MRLKSNWTTSTVQGWLKKSSIVNFFCNPTGLFDQGWVAEGEVNYIYLFWCVSLIVLPAVYYKLCCCSDSFPCRHEVPTNLGLHNITHVQVQVQMCTFNWKKMTICGKKKKKKSFVWEIQYMVSITIVQYLIHLIYLIRLNRRKKRVKVKSYRKGGKGWKSTEHSVIVRIRQQQSRSSQRPSPSELKEWAMS